MVNCRPNGREYAISAGAQAFHCRDSRLDHPGHGAAPAGVGGAHDARFRVGEQHRRAISGQDADDEAGRAGDDGVGLRAGVPGDGAIVATASPLCTW